MQGQQNIKIRYIGVHQFTNISPFIVWLFFVTQMIKTGLKMTNL